MMTGSSTVSLPHADTDPAAGCFRSDQWPLTTTDPDEPDTDGGGVPDGVEDANADGRIDVGADPREGDPNDPADDVTLCSFEPAPEIANVRVTHDGMAATITWDTLVDRCTTYSVLTAESLPWLTTLVDRLDAAPHVDTTPLASSVVRFYVVAADSAVTGPGPTGH